MEKLFVLDPKSKERSISLTLLLISFGAVLAASGLEMAGVIKTVSVVPELFFACAGLYFGRKYTNKAGTSLDKE